MVVVEIDDAKDPAYVVVRVVPAIGVAVGANEPLPLSPFRSCSRRLRGCDPTREAATPIGKEG